MISRLHRTLDFIPSGLKQEPATLAKLNFKRGSFLFQTQGEFCFLLFVLFCFALLFETEFLCVTALTVLELVLVDQAGLELRDLPPKYQD